MTHPIEDTVLLEHHDWGYFIEAPDEATAIYIAAPSLGSLLPASTLGIRVANQGVASVGASYGLLLDAQSGATTTWDVYHVGTAPNIAIGGTFGATEQGILDACRDILIAHGLAAAA